MCVCVCVSFVCFFFFHGGEGGEIACQLRAVILGGGGGGGGEKRNCMSTLGRNLELFSTLFLISSEALL